MHGGTGTPQSVLIPRSTWVLRGRDFLPLPDHPPPPTPVPLLPQPTLPWVSSHTETLDLTRPIPEGDKVLWSFRPVEAPALPPPTRFYEDQSRHTPGYPHRPILSLHLRTGSHHPLHHSRRTLRPTVPPPTSTTATVEPTGTLPVRAPFRSLESRPRPQDLWSVETPPRLPSVLCPNISLKGRILPSPPRLTRAGRGVPGPRGGGATECPGPVQRTTTSRMSKGPGRWSRSVDGSRPKTDGPVRRVPRPRSLWVPTEPVDPESRSVSETVTDPSPSPGPGSVRTDRAPRVVQREDNVLGPVGVCRPPGECGEKQRVVVRKTHPLHQAQ